MEGGRTSRERWANKFQTLWPGSFPKYANSIYQRGSRANKIGDLFYLLGIYYGMFGFLSFIIKLNGELRNIF